MVIHYLNNKILSEVIQAEIMEAGIAEKTYMYTYLHW